MTSKKTPTTGLGASKSLIIDKHFTTLVVDKRLCAGSIDLSGDLTVPGDLVVSGDLTVQGSSSILETEIVRVEDKNIELGVLPSDTPTDALADGGGIILLGSDNHTILYSLGTPASESTWDFSEHINLPSSKEYRIDGNTVLTETSLGPGVVSSSLTEVGVLDTGSIDHGGVISNISVAAAAVITSSDHNLMTGHQVVLSGTDSTPTVDGCYTITVIDENTYSIPITTTGAGSTGNWSGNAFPIDIGLSTLESGPHTINCDSSLEIKGGLNNAVTLFEMNGSDTQLTVNNTNSQSYGSQFNSTITGNFSGTQTNVSSVNSINTNDLTSRPVSGDFTTAYTGTNTTFSNQESALIMAAGRFQTTIATQSPLVAATARGLDARSVSAQDGINVGTISEASGAVLENTGVIGLASSDGALTIGTFGTVNQTRSEMASFVKNNWIDTGNFASGVVGYNPSTGVDQFAYYGLGNNQFNGDTTNNGDMVVSSDLSTYDLTVNNTAFINDIDGGSSPITISTTDTVTGIEIGTDPNVPVSIGNAVSETTVNDNLNVTGDLIVSGNIIGTITSSDGSGTWEDVVFSPSDYFTNETDVAWIVASDDVAYAKTMFVGPTLFYSTQITGASLTSKVDTVTVTDGGSGYTSATVAFVGGGGSGATATATLGGGAVTGVTVVTAGSGFSSTPAVTISGDGSGAMATAELVKPTELRIQLPNNKSPAIGQNTVFYNTLVANNGVSGIGSTIVRSTGLNEPYFNIRDSQNAGWEAQTDSILMLQMSSFVVETSG